MKEVFLKKMILKNFKKVRDLTVNFTDKETFICGENGTCKTTMLDAFYWLLFGKDSTNRADTNFNIKTLGKDGKPILHLIHSVTGVLSVAFMEGKKNGFVSILNTSSGTIAATSASYSFFVFNFTPFK